MNQGIVYAVRYEGEKTPRQIEVAYRGHRQLLPGGSVGFLDQADLMAALETVAESLKWDLPNLPLEAVWADAHSGIGWDWHPSNYNTEIPLEDGRKIVVYRKAVNSHIS